MKIENGIIAECTEAELWRYWIEQEYDSFISFPDFMRACENLGTKVTDKTK